MWLLKNGMAWITPRYSNAEVNYAGGVLISELSSEEEKTKAVEILDNWRAIHSYPMHVFKIRLKRVAQEVDPHAFTVQRLKRVPAILYKLQRRYHGHSPTMKLSQMQDVAGCRAILSDVSLARRLCDEYYLKGDLKHKRVGKKDYVTAPKEDGYRSIHLIYRYVSDKKGKKEYNDLLVEIQLRSRLQHLWATAIETVGFFTRQALKSNEGQEKWMEFFKLVSSAFARMEGCPPVPGTPNDEKELYLGIKSAEADLNVIGVMEGWMEAKKIFEQQQTKGKQKKWQYFLLELDILGKKLLITPYTKSQEQNAIRDYAASENKNRGKKEYDVVLVGADTVNDLGRAYPNYFVDSQEFLSVLKKIIHKY